MPSDPDADDVIVGVKSFIRRQRNPLLDRITFFERRQQKGESFDPYYAHLNELFKASDFTSSLCSPCTARICTGCKDTVRQRHADMLRDRIVCGIWKDDVRNKLLAKPKLTLEDAIQPCCSEEVATQTNVGIPTTGHLNLARRQQSAYQKAKAQPLSLGHPVTRLSSQGKLPTRRPHTTLHSGAHRVEEEPTQKTLVQPGTRPASVARRKDTSSRCARLGSPRTRLADYKYVHAD